MGRIEFPPAPEVIRLRGRVKGPHGSKDVPMVFDPGSTSVVLRARLAQDLGYPLGRESEENASTASQDVPGHRVVLEEVMATGESVRGVLALALDLNPLILADVLLGNTFLRHFTVTFDLEEGYLELRPRPSRPA